MKIHFLFVHKGEKKTNLKYYEKKTRKYFL